ncbi:S49 family peptidase [Aliidiomarina quisquiliarum]|uniref:S49 family peptidase n=1 Tax=Aliidiomarina quisquiliarum TaxID=2938947 RepID=UPI00208F59B2|nr:S49 family peptidase [Aliidiomarina quisquiliarum]MCO4319909.1 S49 family peptidase [Aliidiomarina quisquiliarum]
MLKFLRRNERENAPLNQLDLFNKRSGQFFRVYRRHMMMKTILMIFIGVSVAYSQGLLEREDASPYIQILELDGSITGGSGGMGYRFSHRFLNATKDPKAKAIMIRANSPGGSPMQSEIIFDTIYDYTRAPMDERKPVYVSIQDTCASACIHSVSPADFIGAHRASVVGSIGVIFSSWDASELLGKLGVERRALYLGEHKAILDPFLESDTQSNAIVEEALLIPMYESFTQDILKARGEKLSDMHDDLFSGLAWSGQLALERGLVDELKNTIAIERALEELVEVSNYKSDEKPRFNLLRTLGARWLASQNFM